MEGWAKLFPKKWRWSQKWRPRQKWRLPKKWGLHQKWEWPQKWRPPTKMKTTPKMKITTKMNEEDSKNEENLKNKYKDFLWHNLPFKGFSHYKVVYVTLHTFSHCNCSNCIRHNVFIILNFYWTAKVILMSKSLCVHLCCHQNSASDWSKLGMLHCRRGHRGGWAQRKKNICWTRKTRQIMKGWAEWCPTRT